MNRNERRKLAKQNRVKFGAPNVIAASESALLFAKAEELFDQGALPAAENTCQEILKINPAASEAIHMIGIIAYLTGQLDLALEYFKRAILAQPDFAVAFFNLGLSYTKLNKAKPAETAYRKAIKLDPGNVDYLNNLGNLLARLGRGKEAAAAFQQALTIEPGNAGILNNYGSALAGLGDNQVALEQYGKALAANPELADAYNNEGNAHLAEGNHSAAIASLEKAIALEPDHARAYNNLGNALLDTGQADKATLAYTKSLELSPGQPSVHSNLIYSSLYDPNITAEALISRHIEWDQEHGALLKDSWQNHANAPRKKDKNKQPLRIGFVSADFGKHPVGYFLVSLLENLSAKDFTITCYSDRAQEDELSARIRSASHKWVNCFGNTDDKLASKIRSDSIDMLFELSGHTKANRLSLFAHKPAPVQITWGIGYPGLTGIAAVDVILTDQHHITAAEEALFNEQVAIMPQGVSSYEPPDYAPNIGPLPFDENSFITFGSFNQSRKINASVIGVWAEVLKAVPSSKLLVKYAGLDNDINRERIETGLKAGGINPARVTCEGGAPHAEFVESYNKVDIALDTFPYSGGITTCEALWMGVPVITYPGAIIASRHATSHLFGVGLPELIATDKTEYIKIATKLAANTEYLRELRASLRIQMASSPLCDGLASAQDFTSLLKEIWAERCQ